MAHSPIQPDERIAFLDVLRGFALLGILISNMPFFVRPFATAMAGERVFGGPIDHVARQLVIFFVEGKFYPLFSLLFGIGLFVQMSRAEASGARFGWLYARRLAALGAIGAAHAFLVWPGDILTNYAVLGFVLLVFRNSRPRTLAAAALAFAVVPFLVTVVSGLARSGPGAAPGASAAAAAAHAWQVYGHGSFLEVTRERWHDYWLLLPSVRIMAPVMLCMFLTGLWLARRGVVHDVAGHRRLLVGIFAVCLPLGLLGNALMVIARDRVASDPAWRLVLLATITFGGPLLSFAYASGIALLVAKDGWRRRLAPLAAAGRMPLTNYLLQSLVCTTLFYGYGLGLQGSLGTAAAALLAIAIWAAQLGLSTLWLRRFACGPAEWLWRSLTYGQLPPMRLRPPPIAVAVDHHQRT